jgi:aminoglycoside phosphotransferase (APT) family kinase protein
VDAVQVPPADVLAWVESQVHSPVLAALPMSGGLDAQMFRLTLDGRDDVVLRISRGGDWDDVAHQARVLEMLANTTLPAPRLLGHRPSPRAGEPGLLVQTWLDGDAMLPMSPGDAWLTSLVDTLVAVQGQPILDWMPDRAAYRWAQVEADPEPDYSRDDSRLQAALRRRRQHTPLTQVFAHDDFWIGNTLRDGDRVVGIVDWGMAGVTSIARDATYCAVDMSICYGLDVGDRLVEKFRDRVPVADEEILVWDARAVLMSRHYRDWLTGWNGLGVPVTETEAGRRRAELLDRALTRLG